MMMPRRRRPTTSTSSSTLAYLLLSLIISLLFTIHAVLITRNYLFSSPDDVIAAGGAKYSQGAESDNQWRLDVMMGRGAPLDATTTKRKRKEGDNDDDDFLDGRSGSNDDGVLAEKETASAAPAKTAAAAATSSFHSDDSKGDESSSSPSAVKQKGNNKDSNKTTVDNFPPAVALLRPKRNPKGHRFRGWSHPNEFDIWTAAAQSEEQQQQQHHILDDDNNSNDNNDSGNKKTTTAPAAGNDDDDSGSNNQQAWWRNNSRCFEVDYICHRPNTNQWMYMTPPTTTTSLSSLPQVATLLFQPTMELKPSPWKYDGPKLCETRVEIKVDSPTFLQQQKNKRLKKMILQEGNNNDGSDDNTDNNYNDHTDHDFSFDQCQLSDTPTHIVLQSIFNDMVGEFYSRSLLGLHQTMMMGKVQEDNRNDDDDNNQEQDNKEDGAMPSSSSIPLPWDQDIQFYIHIPLKGKQVLDGHKLLTSGMLSNPNSGMPMSFLDLFLPKKQTLQQQELPPEEERQQQQQQDEEVQQSSNKDKEDDDDCLCYRKMVFCGYDVYTHDEQMNSEDIDFVENYDGRRRKGNNNQEEGDEDEEIESNVQDDDKVVSDDDDEEEEGINPNKNTDTDIDISNNTPSFNPNLKYTLWSAGAIETYKQRGSSTTITADCIKGQDCQGYANLRNLLSSNFVKHYPKLSDDIVTFRRQALLANSLINNDYSGDTKEWLVVGLTQRTYRRAWLNLPTVMKRCNAKFNDRSVVFIEVNVETTSSPYEQLILHRSLDVMIGVHGAQLTQAVVLPPHAHVLEILPWVPSYIRGNWVTRRDAPTPLGIIYHNSDLNHAGYSLDRTSTDLCVGVGEVGSEAEKNCFLKQRKMFTWDNRDFNVEPDVIIQYIEKLVLFMRDDEMGKLCSEVKDRLDERFVLYNIWCKKEVGEKTALSVSHYYAEKGLPNNGKEHYGLGRRNRRKASSIR